MAAPAIIGFSKPLAANGIATVLYAKAQNRFPLMVPSVRCERRIASGDRGEVRPHDRDVAGFDGDVGAGAHRDADVGLGQRGGVVHTVTHHRNDVPVGLQALDDGELVGGHHFGDDVSFGIETELDADCIRSRPIVPGEQHHRQPEISQLADRSRARLADDIGDDERGAHLAVPRRDDDRPPIRLCAFDGVPTRTRERERPAPRRARADPRPQRGSRRRLRPRGRYGCGIRRPRAADPGLRPRWRSPVAMGCSDADSTAPTIRSASSRDGALARHHVDERHHPGGDGAGLVEHHGVERSRRLEHLRASDEDAELRAAAGAGEEGGRGRESERARARDDEDGDRRGESLIGVTRGDEPGDERDGCDEDDGRRRRPPTPGRRAAAPGPCPTAPGSRAGRSARGQCRRRPASPRRRAGRRR